MLPLIDDLSPLQGIMNRYLSYYEEALENGQPIDVATLQTICLTSIATSLHRIASAMEQSRHSNDVDLVRRCPACKGTVINPNQRPDEPNVPTVCNENFHRRLHHE